MKYITAAVALVFLAIVADDIAYVVARRSDFRPEDVSRHLGNLKGPPISRPVSSVQTKLSRQ